MVLQRFQFAGKLLTITFEYYFQEITIQNPPNQQH